MRSLARSSVVFIIACSCEPGLPPPPAEATSSCEIEGTPASATSSATLWFNSLDQVIRIDGYTDDDGDFRRAPYYFAYDEEGRLIEETGPDYEYRYTYAPDRVEQVGPAGTTVLTVVDGHVTHYQGPIERAPDDQWSIDYAYDAAGNMTSSKGVGFYGDGMGNTIKYTWDVEYAYDDRGRLTSVIDMRRNRPTTLVYTETADQLLIDVTSEIFGLMRWSYTFDANDRLIGAAIDSDRDGADDDVTTFTYAPDAIEQVASSVNYKVIATGRCDPPTVKLAPSSRLPVRAYAPHATWYDPIAGYRNSIW